MTDPSRSRVRARPGHPSRSLWRLSLALPILLGGLSLFLAAKASCRLAASADLTPAKECPTLPGEGPRGGGADGSREPLLTALETRVLAPQAAARSLSSERAAPGWPPAAPSAAALLLVRLESPFQRPVLLPIRALPFAPRAPPRPAGPLT